MTDLDKMALLPCPFCGSENIDARGWASADSAGPACDDCGGSAGGAQRTPQENIEAWNKRVPLTAPPGYVLVPVEPTPEMWKAANECGGPYPSWGDYYRAMLAAAPEPKP